MGLVFTVLLGGCAPRDLDLIEAGTTPDGAIVVNFSATCEDGTPATGMTSGDFEIHEDGELVSTYESQQTILNPEMAYELSSLLLLDLSGSILESGNLSALQDAAEVYVDRLGADIPTAIYGFDGREEIIQVVDFTTDTDVLQGGIDGLSGFCEADDCDSSTNLNGAILAGIELLDDRTDTALLISASSLVVFTDGTDRATRATDSEAIAAVNGTSHNVFSVGLGGEIDEDFLTSIGKDGQAFAQDTAEINEAFSEIANAVVAQASSYYTLVYCSPARSGEHTVAITGTWEGQTGSLSYQFDAEGFDGSCDADEVNPAEAGWDGTYAHISGCQSAGADPCEIGDHSWSVAEGATSCQALGAISNVGLLPWTMSAEVSDDRLTLVAEEEDCFEADASDSDAYLSVEPGESHSWSFRLEHRCDEHSSSASAKECFSAPMLLEFTGEEGLLEQRSLEIMWCTHYCVMN